MSRTHRTYPDIYRIDDGGSKKGRDKKPWYKPGKVFKVCEKRSRKAKERNALRAGEEMPIFRKTDVWNFT